MLPGLTKVKNLLLKIRGVLAGRQNKKKTIRYFVIDLMPGPGGIINGEVNDPVPSKGELLSGGDVY